MQGPLGRLLEKLNGIGVHLDLIEQPANIIKLLLSDKFDIVSWDLPRFEFPFTLRTLFRPFPPIVPLVVRIGFDFSIFAQLSVGYDSRGLQTGQFLDGFHFRDLDRAVPNRRVRLAVGGPPGGPVGRGLRVGRHRGELRERWTPIGTTRIATANCTWMKSARSSVRMASSACSTFTASCGPSSGWFTRLSARKEASSSSTFYYSNSTTSAQRMSWATWFPGHSLGR